MGCVYVSTICVNPGNFCGSYSTGVTPDKFPTLQLHRNREVIEVLCIEEVGVDPEPCVHAHGYDVELIMEASRKINIPLV